MEDILEDYEGSDYSDVEEDEVAGSTASQGQKASLPPPQPINSQPPSDPEGTKAQPTQIFHRRSIKRPQPTSLHIGSLDRGTFLGGKNSAPSPGTFEIPDMQPLENSSKRFASTLRGLLASLKANEKDKYYPETEVFSFLFFLFLFFFFLDLWADVFPFRTVDAGRCCARFYAGGQSVPGLF